MTQSDLPIAETGYKNFEYSVGAIEAMRGEITAERARALFSGNWWDDCTPKEAARAQLYQERLCMPFGTFVMYLGRLLGRDVCGTELSRAHLLRAEFERKSKI